MAYVYQVKHKETGEFYIGSKYAMGATPDNTENYLGSVKGKSGSYSLEHREKIKLAQIGRVFTEEHKNKLRLAKIGTTRIVKKIVCPHCNKQGGVCGMTRYHFDNCKDKGQ